MKKYDDEYPQYARLFRFLDAIDVGLSFLRDIPSNIWYAVSLAYIRTIYRAFWKIRHVAYLRRVTGQWIF